jgi:hypothetical protein
MQDVFRANIAENSIYSTLRKIARNLIAARACVFASENELQREWSVPRRKYTRACARLHVASRVNTTKRMRSFD